MNRLLSYAIVALIAIAVGVFGTYKYFDNQIIESTVKYDTVIVKVKDTVPFKLIEQAEIKVQPVKLTVPNNAISTTIITDSIQIETSKYEGVERFSNGTIGWTVYADKLWATEFTLETEKEVITKTVTNTLAPKSAFFAGGGFNFNQGLSASEVGIMYNHKQKWQLGVVAQHDLTGLLPQNTSLGVRAYFKL